MLAVPRGGRKAQHGSARLLGVCRSPREMND